MSSSVLLKHAVRNGKSVAIKLSTEGPGYKRLVDAIGNKAKDNAATTVAAALENGIAVKDEDYAKFDEVKINNMNHESETDPNAHFSCEGWSGGKKVKGFHVMQDPSKQTRVN